MSLYRYYKLVPRNEVTGKDMTRVFFKLVLVVAGLVALILWSNSQ